MKTNTRYSIILLILASAATLFAERPNIVLCMSDDQGWGDVAYNGHPHLVTPTLDKMAASGLRFDRFYAPRSVCSPSRAGFLTGRNPIRMGTMSAFYSMRPEEVTFAEILRENGYSTAHFGKWHLGTVKKDSPLNPKEKGFDYFLSHDNWFDLDPEFSLNGDKPISFKGEGSIVLAEQASEYMKKASESDKPFLVVVWFGSPHSPQISSEEDIAHYIDTPDLTDKQKNYYGEVTGIDRAMKIMRDSLKDLGIADNTILFYTSDNGPSGGLKYDKWDTGGLRGRKGSIYEGGLREPTVLEWPARVKKPMSTSVPASTIDLFPTLLNLAGVAPPKGLPIDGINILDLIDGKMTKRPKPIGFWRYPSGKERRNENWLPEEDQTSWWREKKFRNYKHPNITNNFNGHAAWMDGDWKLHKINGELELYNLATDPSESNNVIENHRKMAKTMAKELEAWQRSIELSLRGDDYPIAAAEPIR